MFRDSNGLLDDYTCIAAKNVWGEDCSDVNGFMSEKLARYTLACYLTNNSKFLHSDVVFSLLMDTGEFDDCFVYVKKIDSVAQGELSRDVIVSDSIPKEDEDVAVECAVRILDACAKPYRLHDQLPPTIAAVPDSCNLHLPTVDSCVVGRKPMITRSYKQYRFECDSVDPQVLRFTTPELFRKIMDIFRSQEIGGFWGEVDIYEDHWLQIRCKGVGEQRGDEIIKAFTAFKYAYQVHGEWEMKPCNVMVGSKMERGFSCEWVVGLWKNGDCDALSNKELSVDDYLRCGLNAENVSAQVIDWALNEMLRLPSEHEKILRRLRQFKLIGERLNNTMIIEIVNTMCISSVLNKI